MNDTRLHGCLELEAKQNLTKYKSEIISDR